MHFIAGENRFQLSFTSLEDQISKDNPVRLIDAFTEVIDLGRLHFVARAIKEEGRPPFEASVFLKIYLYGYLNGIRSSRRLERECERNIELQWLCGKLCPNYHSIADFRKDNPKALKNLFKLFVLFLKENELIESQNIAIDGTKVRAHNSKKNNYSVSKIERHLLYIESKAAEYLTALEQADKQEETIKITNLEEKLERLKKNKLKYELLDQQLKESGQTQVSTTDVDSRALLVQGQVVEVSYNVQAAVDQKNKLVVATHVINRNDRNAMSEIALEAKQNLEVDSYTAILDKGYHNGREIETCQKAGITTIVATQQLVTSNAKSKEYLSDKFIYNSKFDTYTCPEGKELKTQGTWHTKHRERDKFKYKKYRTPACKNCPVKKMCTTSKNAGREIERSQYADAVELNNRNYKENYDLYRKRQEINEHIFGTIKRKWNYYYTNLKGIEKINGEYSLIMLCYNIKRTINILGISNLIERIRVWKPDYTKVDGLKIKMTLIEQFLCTINFEILNCWKKKGSFKMPYLRLK